MAYAPAASDPVLYVNFHNPKFVTPPAGPSSLSYGTKSETYTSEVPEYAPCSASVAMKEAGTGETVSEPKDAEGPLIYVKNGYVYVYGKVGQVLIDVRVKLEAEFQSTYATARETYALVMGTAQRYASQVQGRALLVKGRVLDGIVYVKVKAIEGSDLAVRRAIEGFEAAKTKTLAGRDFVLSRATTGCEIAKVKTLSGYKCINSAVQSIPVPVPIRNGAMYIQGKTCNILVCIKGNAMYVKGRVGDAVLTLKVKGIATYERAAAQAQGAFNGVATAVEPYTRRASEGFMSVKGKVNGYVVQIRAKGDAGVGAASQQARAALSTVKRMLADKVTLVSDKVNSGVTIVSDKMQDAAVYFKDGYVHVVSKVSNKTVYIRARITTVGGTVKVKVHEAYMSNVEPLASTIVAYLTKALEQTKARASDKPVTASAVGGAVLVGAGGVAAGGLAGGLAGATLGMPLALFTLGLSIPIGGLIGSGAGAAAGAVVGGTAGAVGGGAAGYGYEHRAEIKSSMDGTLVKASDYSEKLKAIATSRLSKIKGA